MNDNARNPDDFFPIGDFDDLAELSDIVQAERATSVEQSALESELPRAWKIIFDNSDESEVESSGDSYFPPSSSTLDTSRVSSARIELFDRPVAPEDNSPSVPGEDADYASLSSSSSFEPSSALPTAQEFDEFEYREVVVDRNGLPRQAGAESAEGEFIKRFRERAEQSLYILLKGVLGRFFLTSHFHQEICGFLQKTPPFRKLTLMPREHAKTAIVSGGLPLHILIQPAASNIYFPGLEGSECRILLAGETEGMAKKNLRVLKSIMEENKVFRAFWPHRCWEEGERKSRQWTSESIIIPRENEWPDPTIKAVGVGGAITGARPNVMIKDDLVSFKAMNSDVVMQEAIEWHVASRALLDTYEVESGLQSLEFLIGCLTADSQVTMGDGTKKCICDVKVGDYIWSPYKDGLVWKRKVEAVIPQGYAETWTISTTAHELRATGNHPFLISTKGNKLSWRRADQLQEGDLIVAHKNLRTNRRIDPYLDSEFCWLFGFMLGDGWVNNRKRRGYVCFSPGIDKKQNQRVLVSLDYYFSCNKWTLTKGGYYRTDSVKAAQELVNYGFKGNAKTKRLPDWVYRLPQEQKVQFLRGFCDADGGWVNYQTWRVEICNRLLLEDFRHLACLCGVRIGRLLTRERTSQPPNSPRPNQAISYSSSFNFLTIEREERVNKNPYGDLNVGRDTVLSNDLRFERVTKVERNKVAEEVFDLTVEGTPSFFANGLAVHNTRWAVFDLYSYIIDNDPSVALNDEAYHRIIRNGKILWPEKYALKDIEQLRLEHGSMFYLLYLNSAADPSLTDFDCENIRTFAIVDGRIVFDGEARDSWLSERQGKLSGIGEDARVVKPAVERGMPLSLLRLQDSLREGRGCRIRT